MEGGQCTTSILIGKPVHVFLRFPSIQRGEYGKQPHKTTLDEHKIQCLRHRRYLFLFQLGQALLLPQIGLLFLPLQSE